MDKDNANFRKAGDEVWNEDKTQGYRLTRDVQTGDIIDPTDFEAIGEAPVPRANEVMVQWLADIIWPPTFLP